MKQRQKGREVSKEGKKRKARIRSGRKREKVKGSR